MDEELVRHLVREAIARHLGAASGAVAVVPTDDMAPAPSPYRAPAQPSPGHASMARFHIVRPAGETDCIIEPAVTCTHCGHCLCYGH